MNAERKGKLENNAFRVNPLCADVFPAEDYEVTDAEPIQTLADPEDGMIAEASAVVREGMKCRAEQIVVYVQSENTDYNSYHYARKPQIHLYLFLIAYSAAYIEVKIKCYFEKVTINYIFFSGAFQKPNRINESRTQRAAWSSRCSWQTIQT